ncbi:hypothetical protein [Parasulfitobacter algicola]|uniref:GCN5-related N-acetyltransferase n=1 Tax=Parasulfitobacter algicola TaxID=2614809 RepID=A0ABX2IQI1_9RHOB|nr:hypothetical protein [Sulfitobacter algicola]NSX54281.1 hypothetical protein [Sulfitobacter algicola]
MRLKITDALISDLPQIVELLLADAKQRHATNPVLWAIADDAEAQIEKSVRSALEDEKQPFRQKWLTAVADGQLFGLAHTMLVPVPPIYAGKLGNPGLLLDDCCIAENAPDGTADALIAAAETDLRNAGAKVLLASSAFGDDWQSKYTQHNYEPLTLYLAKTGFDDAAPSNSIRAADEPDLSQIVARSAKNRAILSDLNPFWEPHPEADIRFGNLMKRSLTLADRDMIVSGVSDRLDGYAIVQPATHMHFPTAHDIRKVGIIDDYFHVDYADPLNVSDNGIGAKTLLLHAEAAFKQRGFNATLIVCPAAWLSKIAVLENTGYQNATLWMIKR